VAIELIDLLSERQIVHPSRIVSSTFQGGEVRLSIEGYPWWQGSLSHDPSRILFRFSGLTSGNISLITLLNDGDD
jgi:hypothetical protein